MHIDPRQAERELRELLAAGVSIGDALRTLHHGRGHGLLFLKHAVMAARDMDGAEAARVVVRETAAAARGQGSDL